MPPIEPSKAIKTLESMHDERLMVRRKIVSRDRLDVLRIHHEDKKLNKAQGKAQPEAGSASIRHAGLHLDLLLKYTTADFLLNFDH
jgi:hypothetical protein